MSVQQKKHPPIRLLLLICGAIFTALLVGGLVFHRPSRNYLRSTASSAYARLSPAASQSFPKLNTAELAPVQQRIVTLTEAEYKERPVSYDRTVLKYSEGAQEAWCADFVSWVMNEAGVAFKNPNSGHWRIPGVLTLQAYFKQQNRYQSAATNYQPKTGDVAIYIGDTTLDGRSQQHANIVLKVEGDTMTTIGGNERGRMRISRFNYKQRENNLVGFGLLNEASTLR